MRSLKLERPEFDEDVVDDKENATTEREVLRNCVVCVGDLYGQRHKVLGANRHSNLNHELRLLNTLLISKNISMVLIKNLPSVMENC